MNVHGSRRTTTPATHPAEPALTSLAPGSGRLPARARLRSGAPELSLDGGRAFRLGAGQHDLTEGFEAPEFDDAAWDEVAPAPACWSTLLRHDA
ncbi:hypothetical protein [Myceligenerans crystallogenes]|uniref:Uncharacterized protein n=1 Tax=Myceligenerans crystallogenes TaxID=316335 RepID=A0ABN2NFY1_9MICO